MKKSKYNILVLEDENSLLKAISDKLTKEGFEVFGAKSVTEGLGFLNKAKIDAVWLDHYLLGKENGLDFVMQFNKKPRNVPIFVVSNTTNSEKINEYMHLGVSKFYIKAEKSLGDIITDIKKAIK